MPYITCYLMLKFELIKEQQFISAEIVKMGQKHDPEVYQFVEDFFESEIDDIGGEYHEWLSQAVRAWPIIENKFYGHAVQQGYGSEVLDSVRALVKLISDHEEKRKSLFNIFSLIMDSIKLLTGSYVDMKSLAEQMGCTKENEAWEILHGYSNHINQYYQVTMGMQYIYTVFENVAGIKV